MRNIAEQPNRQEPTEGGRMLVNRITTLDFLGAVVNERNIRNHSEVLPDERGIIVEVAGRQRMGIGDVLDDFRFLWDFTHHLEYVARATPTTAAQQVREHDLPTSISIVTQLGFKIGFWENVHEEKPDEQTIVSDYSKNFHGGIEELASIVQNVQDLLKVFKKIPQYEIETEQVLKNSEKQSISDIMNGG